MAFMPFASYAPDTSDYNASHINGASNVIPRGDGWGPFPSFAVFTAALASACRGFFFARRSDGSVAVFAGTATKLYLLDNTDFTWTDVSKGGSTYSSVPSSDQWQFAQHGNSIVAVQANTAPQLYTLGSSSAFDDLTGSPPQARYVAVVLRFLVLSGLVSNPYRIHWSGLNDITEWSSGSNQSDTQDFPDGGVVRGVAGGEIGVIMQDGAIRRMVYAPGSPVVFQIDRISEDHGILAPLSMIRDGDRIFFYSSEGFYEMAATGSPVPIGKEQVDRTFAADLDTGNLQLFVGSADPRAGRVYWSYKSLSGSSALFDKIISYDWGLQRWGPPIEASGEYLASLARPGLTLENLDAIAPTPVEISGAADNGSGLIRLTVASTPWTTGTIVAVSGVTGTTEANGNWTITVVNSTHIDLQGSTFANAYVSGGIVGGSLDAMTFSLDDVSTAALPNIAAVNTDHKLGFYNGAALEAMVETAEQAIADRRVLVRGFRPITDASTVYGYLKHRATLNATATTTAETAMNDHGVCPQRRETRYARAGVRIPAGSAWTFISGVEPDFIQTGQR